MFTSAAGRVQQASTASFVRLARHRAWPLARAASQARWLADVANAQIEESTRDPGSSLAVDSPAQHNAVGVQLLSQYIHKQIFPPDAPQPPEELVKLARDHLERHELYGKNTDSSDPIAFDLPPLVGETLDEHFHKLGVDCARPYLDEAKAFANANLPEKPREWVEASGWTKYHTDATGKKVIEKVDAPDPNEALCFDTEVMWKESPYAVMACAASTTAWYVWLSPWLLGESKDKNHLVPLGDPSKHRVIVGHNVGYDRARVLEEYSLTQTRSGYLDTMSLHVAVNGMCSQQRPTWMRCKKNRELRERIASETPDLQLAEALKNRSMYQEEDLWVERSSVNSLRDVAKFHLDVTVDKDVRDDFGELDREAILAKLNPLLTYCAADVEVTHRVFQRVFPRFLAVCPHPVSFAALRHLSSVFLPINKTWDSYIKKAEATYHETSDSIQQRLIGLAEKAVKCRKDPEIWQNDPWLSQLDWSGQEIRMVKGKKGEPDRPRAKQKLPGMPKWYKGLFPAADKPMALTVRSRIAPLLLKLAWDGNPMFWSNQYGWTFRVPLSDCKKYEERQMPRCVFEDADPALKVDEEHAYFKLPHKDGPTSRCANPMAKGYLSYCEDGTLSSEYPLAKEALEMNASCSYWISARDRIMSQMAVYEDDLPRSKEQEPGESASASASASGESVSATTTNGFILPQIIPMGTITRRAVENTWLTASNAKRNRVGSELKAMVKAPEGYSFVGADVDSEELWIASLMGDATFKMHGGNAIGFMTLEGHKAAGTDLHSRTAKILGISRNNAKVFNYGRIYGAGLKFAGTLLRQFNPSLTEKATMETASMLYSATKGAKTKNQLLYKRPFWRGGTESFVFNKLEEFAEQESPRTPVLGAGITEALMTLYINKGGFLTSRINWAIQSSGVDYLHLLIVSMDYLIRRFKIEARLAITVHDEIRYLVKDKDKYRAALALQVSNIWTRAMFAQQVGIEDLPQSCAFFSAVDIDHVLRKEVDLDCVTPSHPEPIAHGESIDIHALLQKGDEARLDPDIVPDADRAPKLDGIEYTPRKPVMQDILEASGASVPFIKAQISSSNEELVTIVNEVKASQPKSKRATQAKPVLPYHAHAQTVPTRLVTDMMKTRSESWFKQDNKWGGFKNAYPTSKVLHIK